MTRTLLIQMPFQSLRRPSIGLSLLRAALVAKGHACDIRYLNIDFAARIGPHLFETISDGLPADLLFGDIVFSIAGAQGSEPPGPPQRPLNLGSFYRRRSPPPQWLCEVLPELALEARRFISDATASISSEDYDLVGFTTTFNLSPSLALSRAIKRVSPRVPTILGGASCEGRMGEAIHSEFTWVDYVCRGEGEGTILEVAKYLDGEAEGLDGVAGLIWRGVDGTTRVNSRPTGQAQPLNSGPKPDYTDWFSQLDSSGLNLSRDRLLLPIETSRGCWYGAHQHCTFCGLNGLNLAYRSKDPARVMGELKDLQRYGIENVHAVDNILDFSYFKSLLPHLALSGHPFRLFYETKSNLTRRHMQLLREAGIRGIQPGIESLSTPVLKLMRKGVAAYQNVRVLKWASEFGIGVTWNLLYGFPREDPDEYLAMAKLVPLLRHLQPPTMGRVRLDRFSPLHFEGPELGVACRYPSEGYALIYDLPQTTLEDLAYYFDFDSDSDADPDDYVSPLQSEVSGWQRAASLEALVGVSRADEYFVFDTRRVATCQRGTLRGTAKSVYLACDGGSRLREICALVGEPEREVEPVLRELVDLKWIIEIDGRYLGVVVEMHDPILQTCAYVLLEPLAVALFMAKVPRGEWMSPMAHLSEAEALALRGRVGRGTGRSPIGPGRRS